MADDKEGEEVKSVQKYEVFDSITSGKGESEPVNKVRLKKIREKEEAMEMEVEDEGIGVKLLVDPMKKCMRNDVKRVCHVCSKVLSSGKALGGHMRIHMIHPPQVQPNKRKPPPPPPPPASAAFCPLIKHPICTVCGKNFPSMKSLFGHMRCHPDRGWRGIHPPASSSSSSDDFMEAAAVVDLAASLKRAWPVTAKRGRKAVEDDHDQAQLLEAVKFLMMLARGDCIDSSSVPKTSFCKEEMDEINHPALETKKPVVDQAVVVLNESLNNKKHTYFSDDQEVVLMIKSKKKRKKRCLGSLLDASPSPRVLDFDLNQMPESDQDDNEEAARFRF